MADWRLIANVTKVMLAIVAMAWTTFVAAYELTEPDAGLMTWFKYLLVVAAGLFLLLHTVAFAETRENETVLTMAFCLMVAVIAEVIA